MVCTLCHLARMEPHPEFFWWSKCPICGYCELKHDLTPYDRKCAEHNPLARLPLVEAVHQIELEQQDRYVKSLPCSATSSHKERVQPESEHPEDALRKKQV